MSPDWAAKAQQVPYAKLDNPQTLNLYAYVGNNPLSRIDKDGHYECSGSKEQCGAIRAGIDAIQKADANLKAGTTGKAMLDKALTFYGTEGEKNGVKIDFNNTNPEALGSTSTEKGITTISFGKDAFSNMQQAGKGETVAHEGTHGVDQQKNPSDPTPKTFWQFYDTEYHAYQAESAVDKRLGTPNETDEHPVWFPGITPQQRTTNHKGCLFERLPRRWRLPMSRMRIIPLIVVLCIAALSVDAIRAQTQPLEKTSLCQLIAQPSTYLAKPVRLHIQVRMFRHGTAISDPQCTGKTLLLTSNPAEPETESVSKFYEFLSKHRQSSSRADAEITGRLVKGADRGFVIKRDYDFELDSVLTFSK